VTHHIDRAGFIRSTGNTVWWGTDEPRIEAFAAGAQGWQVDLADFAEAMLDGVSGPLVRIAPAPEATARDTAAFVLDCTGRTGVLAKEKTVREYDAGPKTIALVGEWRTGPSWSVPDDSHTVIESYRDGWMWSVPIARGIRHVSAMIDPQRSALRRSGAPRDVYLAEIAKTRQFTRLLSDARLAEGPWGWDATPYRSREYARENWLLVGDAASFIDPLSSAGVKKALASAWLAAVVVNTCMVNPGMREHALAFYSARERDVEQKFSDTARLFLTAAAKQHRDAFWADRVVDEPTPPDEVAAVRSAFDDLKARDLVRLRVSPAIRFDDRPHVVGREIVLGAHIVADDGGLVTKYLYNVDLPTLLELAPTVNGVGELLSAYDRRAGGVDPKDFLQALSTAVARGWLVSE
jgi:hypothetical protein